MFKVIFFIVVFFIHGYTHSQTEAINLLFLGDIMGHGPQIKAAYNPLTRTYDYTDNFKYIKHVLSKADVTIANLEVTLGNKPYKGYPQFSSPPALATAIKNAGIDIIGTSNNHSCDSGKAGIEKTINILDSLSVTHLGTYKSQTDKDSQNPLIINQNGIRIALLNYTYDTNGIPIPKPNVVNLLDKDIIAQDVMQAKAKKPDVIIAFVHWGEQYMDLPVQSQKDWFTYFNSLGIKIVIGSHPHVVEPMLWNKQDKSLVVYSLGNFVSNQRQHRRDGGALFSLTLQRNIQGGIDIVDASYLLHWTYKYYNNGKLTYQVLPIDEFRYKRYFFKNPADYQTMIQYNDYTVKLLGKHNQNIQKNRQVLSHANWLMAEFY